MSASGASGPTGNLHLISASYIENDRFEIYNRCPMSDVAMAVSTDADTDADVACLDHLAK